MTRNHDGCTAVFPARHWQPTLPPNYCIVVVGRLFFDREQSVEEVGAVARLAGQLLCQEIP